LATPTDLSANQRQDRLGKRKSNKKSGISQLNHSSFIIKILQQEESRPNFSQSTKKQTSAWTGEATAGHNVTSNLVDDKKYVCR
jgi:hypothetical protein